MCGVGKTNHNDEAYIKPVKLFFTNRINSSRTVRLLIVVVVVSTIQRIGCQFEKLLYTVANPARGLLNREKKKKRKSLAALLAAQEK